MTKIGERLKRVRDEEGKTQPEMADIVGVHFNTLKNYEAGSRLPDIDFLVSFAHKTGEDFLTLLELRLEDSNAEGASEAIAIFNAIADSLEDKPVALRIEEARAGYVAVPLYNDVRAAAGAGAVVTHERSDDALIFQEEWIRFELGARPQDLYLIRVGGDSMEPTLRSGDAILVDRRATRPDREGVYIMRMNDMLLVKRLQALPGGRIRVTSDNPAFAPYEVAVPDLQGDDIAIIGRVVWVGRRL